MSEPQWKTYGTIINDISAVEPAVTTTATKVKEAAASCPDAARVLQKLFPDVFTPSADSLIGKRVVSANPTQTIGQHGIVLGQTARKHLDGKSAGGRVVSSTGIAVAVAPTGNIYAYYSVQDLLAGWVVVND